MGKIVAIDVETTGLNPWKDKLLGLSVADDTGTTYYPWDGKRTTVFPFNLLADAAVTKVAHNARFDLKFLIVNGLVVNGTCHDTLLLAQLVDENRSASLKNLAREYFGATALACETELKKHLAMLKLKMSDLGDARVDQAIVARYCNEDTRNTLALYNRLMSEIEPELLAYYNAEMLPIERVLLKMELSGNLIDLKKMKEAEEALITRIQRTSDDLNTLVAPELSTIRDELWEKEKRLHPKKAAAGKIERPEFNWASGPQKQRLFYGLLGLGDYCQELTKAGSPSLDRKTLRNLNLPQGKLKQVIDLQIDLQSYSKNKSAYIDGLNDRMHEGVVHGEYNQAAREDFGGRGEDEGGTVTGRLSHSNPNLGNLPRSGKEGTPGYDYYKGTFVKDLFIPRDGYTFIYADYSQIELRCAAHLAGDRPFIDAFNSGEDPHQTTAVELGITRQQAKTVNFLLIYFGSPWRLAFELGWNPKLDPELRKAEAIHQAFFTAHPELRSWIFDQRRLVMEKGFVVSMFGRKRRLPEVWNWDKKVKEHALKQAGNFVVQSAAASIAKRAMVALDLAGFDVKNSVHDSITCMVRKEEAEEKLVEMTRIMTSVEKLSVPLEVDAKIISTFRE